MGDGIPGPLARSSLPATSAGAVRPVWSRRREHAVYGLAALAFALLLHGPVLFGRVPFPADIVLGFPPWETIQVPEDFASKHAEMGDVAVQAWPFRVLMVRALSEGT